MTYITAGFPLSIRALLLACLLARAATALAGPVAEPASYARASSFEYDPTTGLIATETVEPDNAQLCVKTIHSYDAYGNRTGSTVKNCDGATGNAVFESRANTSKYEAQEVTTAVGALQVPAGMAATSVQNALSQQETRTIDPRFGTAQGILGPNGLPSAVQLDDFGRAVRAIGTDGTSIVTAYCLIEGRVDNIASNSANCPALDGRELRGDAVSFVHSEPRSTADAKSGPAKRVYADAAGRTIRTVTEAFDGAGQPGGTSRLIVQDVDFNAYGLAEVTTQPYFLDSEASTTGGSGEYGMTYTVYNAVGTPAEVYVIDPKGTRGGVAFGSRGTRTASRTKLWNVGLTTYRENDKDERTVEEKNVDGKVVRVTDPDGAQVAHVYDAFGNMVQSRDPLQNAITVKYDVRGRKLSMDDPDAGHTDYDYNALGELVWQKTARGHESTFGYDKLGRQIRRVEPEYTTTWTFDAYADGGTCGAGIGKLCEVATSHGIHRRYAYDAKGRPVGARTDVTNGPSFASGVQYDGEGRVQRQIYPSGLTVQYGYTAKGFLESLSTVTAATLRPLPATAGGAPGASVPLAKGTLLWKAQAANAWGNVESQAYGNGIVNMVEQDGQTGRVKTLSAGAGFAKDVVDYRYEWNNVGQLKLRTDALGDGRTGAVTDSYEYDNVGRMNSYTVATPAIQSLERTVSMQHNAAGALLYKSDVGIYTYPKQAGVEKRPHAVSSVAGAHTATYQYDDTGNMVSASAGAYRDIRYTSFGLPDSENGISGPSSSPRYTWLYDEGHQRLKEVRAGANGTRTTWMLHPDNAGGLAFESAEDGGITTNRHYLSAGGKAIGVLVSEGALPSLGAELAPAEAPSMALVKAEYWHKDHQGSLLATTDHAGAVTARYAYDPYGKRRIASGNYDKDGTLVYDWNRTSSGTDRGYTGHEHLDDIGVVHMNGRTFDPKLGVFMQPDPLIQDPMNTQNYNRYGYCFGDPMTCSDPTGYSFRRNHLRMLRMVIGPVTYYHLRQIAETKAGYQIGSIVIAAVSTYCTGAAAFCNAGGQADWAMLSGRSWQESVRIGAVAGLTTAAMGQVGETWGTGKGATDYSRFMNTLGHAAVGCGSSVAGGGKCADGAISGGFSAAWGTYGPGYMQGNTADVIATNTMISAGVGGISSVLAGGDFATGARSAAYGYLFNCLAHECIKKYPELAPFEEIMTTLSIDIDENLATAEGMSLKEFYDSVKSYGRWDYKNRDELKSFADKVLLDNFGNVHFGAVARAYGFSLTTSLFGGGTYQTWVQNAGKPNVNGWSLSDAFISGPDAALSTMFGKQWGDNPGDAQQIAKGWAIKRKP